MNKEFRHVPDETLRAVVGKLEPLIRQIEDDVLLSGAKEFRRRLEALDLLDAHLPEAVFTSFEAGPRAKGLYRRVRKVVERLEAANRELYESIRCEIQHGRRPEILLQEVRPLLATGQPSGMGYDELDELLSGFLQFEEPAGGADTRQPEIVFYQPTPARHIFYLIDRTALAADDVLVDLGSGLGHVPLLASICTGARTLGIELEAAYVECARECAARLNLSQAAFVAEDARTADLSAGTVFYLHTPFTGSILRCVLERLKGEAARRQIRVCTYGPCSSLIAAEPWLEAASEPANDRIVLFRSR